MRAKKYLFAVLFLLLIPIASSITLQDLLDFFNFDFFGIRINVTNKNDFMADKNNNSVNDTLIIELTTNGNAGNYFFVLDLHDNGNIIINETNKTLRNSDKINITFSTEFLASNKFNYSIKIYGNDFSLKYRKDNIETNTYNNYEKGVSIINMTDSSINNLSILINLTLNITSNATYEIISYLKFNETAIFSKTNKSMNEGINYAEIYFDNETIKNTHYIGNFNLTSIKLNNKLIKANYTTAFYNYKDFAQTSYFLNFLDNAIDTNSNDLFDYLKLNISVEIKNNGTFNVELALHDLFDNFLVKENATNYFNVGAKNFIININGTKIYNKKLDGPYVINYIKLTENDKTINQLKDFHTTQNYNYTDFEKPPLPDLMISLTTDGNNNYGINNVSFNVTIKNIGTGSAFNIFSEIFDNGSFSSNKSRNILLKDNEIIYSFNLIDINDTKISAIADLKDLFEEINESNNIIEKTIKINKKPVLNEISDISANETDLIEINLSALDPNGDSLIYFINNSKFSKNNNIFSWRTSTTDSGNYTFKSNVSDGYLHDFKIFKIIIMDKPEIDNDNDGINDSLDNLIGDENSINTSTLNLSVIIGNSTDIFQIFNGTREIKFKDNNLTVVEFMFNFSQLKLNLSNFAFEKQKGNGTGAFLVRGIRMPEGFTKTIYVDKLNSLIDGICIKDKEMHSINEISADCNAENEFQVECDGTLQNGYSCTYINSTLKYKVMGLKFSGIKQIDYEKPPETSASSSAAGGGGRRACTEQWQCSGWNECANNEQKRSCIDLNGCGTSNNKPIETQSCTLAIEKPIEKIEEELSEETENKSIFEKSAKTEDKEKTMEREKLLSKITGQAITEIKPKKEVGLLAMVFEVVFGLSLYFYFKNP